jgi:hypothetical protein
MNFAGFDRWEHLTVTSDVIRRPTSRQRAAGMRNKTKNLNMKKMLLMVLGLSLSGLLAGGADGEKKPAPPSTPRSEVFKKYDKNGDGKLDEEERAALQKERQQEMLKKYDKNNDGKIDETERVAVQEDRKKLREEALARREAQQKKQEKQPEKKEDKN